VARGARGSYRDAISTPMRWNVPGGSIPRLYRHLEALGMEFIEVEAIEKLPNGKISRKMLGEGVLA
jgi:hypothetical protein